MSFTAPFGAAYLVLLVVLVLLERMRIALVSSFSLWTLNATTFSCLSRETHKTKSLTEMGIRRWPLWKRGEEQQRDFRFSCSPTYPWPFGHNFRDHVMFCPHLWRSEELNPRKMGRSIFPPVLNNQILEGLSAEKGNTWDRGWGGWIRLGCRLGRIDEWFSFGFVNFERPIRDVSKVL